MLRIKKKRIGIYLYKIEFLEKRNLKLKKYIKFYKNIKFLI